MPAAFRLPLDVFYEREARHPRQRFLVQPVGGGQVETLTWEDVGHQARCAAHWLRARELPQGSHIALISKNCAHWIIADLAIWMAGHVSVTVCPDADRRGVAYALGHSEARLVFVGRPFENAAHWRDTEAAVPQDIPVIRLPQAEPGRGEAWYAIVAATPRLRTVTLPDPGALATILYVPG
ncbi:MAG: AMP-binding protein, partial [Pseudomonas sp.]